MKEMGSSLIVKKGRMMKNKKIGLMMACCGLAMVMAAGCGAKIKSQNPDAATQNQAIQTQQETNTEALGKDKTQEENKEEVKKKTSKHGAKEKIKTAEQQEVNDTAENKENHKMQGKLVEKKDFMFVIEDQNNKPSAFAFSDQPEGYDNLKVNDNVVVEYTGEVSETEAFTGEVLSVTKI